MAWLERLETKALSIVYEDGFTSIDAHLHGHLPSTARSYARDVGEGLDSNVVMSPVNWILRNFTEAVPVVEAKRGGRWEYVEDHALELLLQRPNPFYNDDLMWKATVVSFCLDGNAYWQKIRNPFGEVLGYWYMPHFLVEPEWPDDGSEFISRYRYRPNPGRPGLDVVLAPRDVIHFRFGLDPRNVRKGLSPVRPLLREVFTDEEAANFSASILRNMGVPGGVIAPHDANAVPSQEDVKSMKDYMRSGFTGDRRGEWLVLGTPTDIKQFGFDPQSLMLGNLRDIAEERVCAALGVPAAVVGFGSGLQQTKVGATMKELRKEAWDSCIRPMQNSLAKQLTNQALPDFQVQTRRFRVRFDASEFAASQEEETEKATRYALLVEKGVLRVDRAQEALGLEVDPSRAVYLGPSEAAAKPEPGPQPDPAPAPPINGNGNGNGAKSLDDEILEVIAARVSGNGLNHKDEE
jgi:HK97 family phage portal protein